MTDHCTPPLCSMSVLPAAGLSFIRFDINVASDGETWGQTYAIRAAPAPEDSFRGTIRNLVNHQLSHDNG